MGRGINRSSMQIGRAGAQNGTESGRAGTKRGRNQCGSHYRSGANRSTAALCREMLMALGVSGPLVTQVFCSALPVAYSPVPSIHWRRFASLVLEAAYEATLWAAVENARRGG